MRKYVFYFAMFRPPYLVPLLCLAWFVALVRAVGWGKVVLMVWSRPAMGVAGVGWAIFSAHLFAWARARSIAGKEKGRIWVGGWTRTKRGM